MYGVDSETPVGEAWVVFDGNEVATGEFAGRVFREVIPEVGEDFLGHGFIEKYGYEYPLMIKFIDAGDWLSVQVHPDDEYAARFEKESGFRGKDEAWLILEAAPQARIVYGLSRAASAEEVERAALDGSLLELLNYVEVKKGDFVYLPAGTIHALGPGILAAEVSQRSDLTYRIYDYGRGRELHLKKALEVAVLEPVRPFIRQSREGFGFRGGKFEVEISSGVFRVGDVAAAVVRLDRAERGFLVPAATSLNRDRGSYLYCQPVAL